ncbi:MAG: flavodoxin family protein [Spirochaetales bacterium]|nr:flavodoxin family protein [Spirochaetales bacterium]
MKKITAIIGSPLKTRSNTAEMTRLFLQKVQELDESIEYEIIVLGNNSVKMCTGCWACTEKGYCVQNDDLQAIQNKLLESDMLILGSPVYVHAATAQFKAFCDRIFIWFHTMKLLGKPVITAVTTAGSGTRPVEKYLNMICCLLGTIQLGHLRGIGYKPGQLQEKESIQQKYRTLAAKTVSVLNGKKTLKPSFMNKLYFWSMRMKAIHAKEVLVYEYNYWKQKNWLDKSYVQACRMQASGL